MVGRGRTVLCFCGVEELKGGALSLILILILILSIVAYEIIRHFVGGKMLLLYDDSSSLSV